MVSAKSLQVVLLVTIFTYFRYAYCAQVSSTSTTWSPDLPTNLRRGSRDNSVNSGKVVAEPSFSISPSFSYQFHTNDHEHLDQIVLPHNNPVRNVQSGGPTRVNVDNESSGSTKLERISNLGEPTLGKSPTFSSFQPKPVVVSYTQQRQPGRDAQKRRDGERKPEQFLPNQRDSAPQAFPQEKYLPRQGQVQRAALPPSKSDPNHSERQKRILEQSDSSPSWNPMPSNEKLRRNSTSFVYSRPLEYRNGVPTPVTYNQKVQPQPGYTPGSYSNLKTTSSAIKSQVGKTNRRKTVQPRADNEDEYQQQGHYEHDHDAMEANEVDQHELYYDYASSSTTEDSHTHLEEEPEVRDFGSPDKQFFPEFPGPGPFGGPLPPPPPPLKGSIDYILIPLILIGLAGPIFVVLYVILGGFEARLSPINTTRRSLSDYSEYKPYIDSVTSSVGRALEKYECFDYAACHLTGFGNKLGFSDSTSATLESALTSVTPKEYLPQMRSLFSSLRLPEQDCQKYRCSDMLTTVAKKFPF